MTKLMTNNTSGINTKMKVNGQKLETVTSLKYLGSVITDEGFKPEILSRTAQTTAALTGWNQSGMTGVFLSVPRYNWRTFLPACLWIMDPHSRASKKNTSHGNEMLLQDIMHLIQRPCYQLGSPCQDPAGNQTTWRPPDHSKEMQTPVVWTYLLFIRFGQNHIARHSETGWKTMQTEEEVGRPHQGRDRPRVCQDHEGSGEQRKKEKAGCKIIRGASMTLRVKR